MQSPGNGRPSGAMAAREPRRTGMAPGKGSAGALQEWIYRDEAHTKTNVGQQFLVIKKSEYKERM